MEKPVLNPDDLVVTSFDTTFGGFEGNQPTTDEPTPNTRCFDCPP